MSNISATQFQRHFQPGTMDQLRDRAAGNGVTITAAQERALRAADLNHDGIIGNSTAERNATWRAVDDFDRNGTRWSVSSGSGTGYDLARGLATGSGSPATPGGGGSTPPGGAGPGAGPGRTSPGATPVGPTAPVPPAEIDPYLRSAQTMDRLRAAIDSGRIQPGTPGGDATARVVEGLRSTPVMIYSFDDPVAANNYNEFVRARGQLIDSAEARGIIPRSSP